MSRPALILAFVLVASGCKPSGNDAYAEALVLLGEAERSDCKMGFDKSANQQTIDVSTIAECKVKIQAALDKLLEAQQLGVDTREVQELIAETEDKVRRLESMHRTVLRLDNDLGFDDRKAK